MAAGGTALIVPALDCSSVVATWHGHLRAAVVRARVDSAGARERWQRALVGFETAGSCTAGTMLFVTGPCHLAYPRPASGTCRPPAGAATPPTPLPQGTMALPRLGRCGACLCVRDGLVHAAEAGSTKASRFLRQVGHGRGSVWIRSCTLTLRAGRRPAWRAAECAGVCPTCPYDDQSDGSGWCPMPAPAPPWRQCLPLEAGRGGAVSQSECL